MVIVKKDIDNKEIQIQGFRNILRNPKHPDYKELRIYIKKGWIPIDPEDDERELQKAKKRKQIAKENKARRPSYNEMEKVIKKLKNEDLLKDFNDKRKIKNNYVEVLKWYNENIVEKNEQKDEETTPPATPSETREGQKQTQKATETSKKH